MFVYISTICESTATEKEHNKKEKEKRSHLSVKTLLTNIAHWIIELEDSKNFLI